MSRIYRVVSILSLFVLLTFVLVIPGYAYFDSSKTVLVDYVFQSSYSQSGFTVVYQHEMELNGNFENVFGADSSKKYFRNEFYLKTSNGSLLFNKGDSGVLSFENIYIALDGGSSGYKNLSSINRLAVFYRYSDGSGEWIDYNADAFSYNSPLFFLNIPISVTKDVVNIYVQINYDVTNFGYSLSTNFAEYDFRIGWNNLNYYFTPSYASADPGALDDYENSEKELIDATSGGIDEITSVTNNLSKAFLPSSSIYRGAMFFGNMMSDIVGQIPDLNMIILVSLAIGIVMVILTSVLFSMGSGKGEKVKKNKGG